MNENKIIQNLFQQARNDEPPQIDYTQDILSRIHDLETCEINVRLPVPLLWMAVISSATAIAMAVLTGAMWDYLNDPIVIILAALSGGIV